ncbi:MAG TPA: TIGR03435 family protein [Terriglobales bacterium]|nr:TIGR03435 family protein [Terriglobales bacterium]
MPHRPTRTSLIAFALLGCAFAAQTVHNFEAASVKRDTQLGLSITRSWQEDPQRIALHANHLSDYLRRAFELKPYQLHVPGWVSSDFYDIDATTSAPVSTAEMRVLLRSLLIERFDLHFHYESKSIAVYFLSQDGAGPGLRPAGPTSSSYPRISSSRNRFTVSNASMDDIASSLADIVHRPVFNRSKQAGNFDFDIDFAATDLSADTDHASIFTVLRQQLGLKLTPGKASVKMFILDRATPPNPN